MGVASRQSSGGPMHSQASASGQQRVMPSSHYAPKTKIMQI